MKYLTLLLYFFTSVSFSQENPLEEVIKKATEYEKSDYYNIEIKKLPDHPNLSVAGVIRNEKQEGQESYDVDLVLLLIDNVSQKIISQHIEKRKYSSDAIGLSGISLDMANYKVTDNWRAFGVRDSYIGSSQPNPYDTGNLSLYIIKDNKFQLILNKFEVYESSEEWDMSCYFDGKQTNSVFIMQKTKTNGYYDIKVSTVKTLRKSRKKGNDCVDSETKLKPTYKTLKFVGGKYALSNK